MIYLDFMIGWHKFLSDLHSWLHNWKFYVVLLLILSPFFVYLDRRFNFYLFKRSQKKVERKKILETEKDEISKILSRDLKYIDLEEVSKLIESIHNKLEVVADNKELEEYEEGLYKKLEEAEREKVLLEYEKQVRDFKIEKYELEEEYEELEKRIKERKREEMQARQDILSDLEAYRTPVFKRDEIADNEVNALLGEGYVKVNEFCVYERKVISALVKSPLNHSNTHTFLVWSVKRLLENTDGIKNIIIHLTKEADITFKFNKKDYAVEIETGTLLRKKDQLDQKIKHLNRNYPNRWMIVASHRDLVGKYSKFGKTCERKNTQKMLQRVLNSA